MARRINRTLELLADDQAIYYIGGHTGHPLIFDRGRQDADTWADYINIGMEHGSFDTAWSRAAPPVRATHAGRHRRGSGQRHRGG